MTRPAAFGIVAIASADLRREPRHDAELRSQYLLGETVRIVGARGGGQWLKVRGVEDGYGGWMRGWALVPVTRAGFDRWRSRARGRVVATIASLRGLDPERGPLMPVFLGSRLERLGGDGRLTRVRLPDGRRAALPSPALASGSRPARSLRERVLSLRGAPYLWGGRTPAGFDCSGFTQIVLGEQGTPLPRDARLQRRATRPLGRGETAREGDLVFFGRTREAVSHVGIMLDRCTFVHCRGWVRTASLDPENTLCEKDLLAQFRGVRRPSEGAKSTPSGRRRRGKSP